MITKRTTTRVICEPPNWDLRICVAIEADNDKKWEDVMNHPSFGLKSDNPINPINDSVIIRSRVDRQISGIYYSNKWSTLPYTDIEFVLKLFNLLDFNVISNQESLQEDMNEVEKVINSTISKYIAQGTPVIHLNRN